MHVHRDKTEEVTIVEKILRSMTLKFNFVVCVIEESHDIDMLSIDELQSSLLIHEQNINQQEKEEVALKAPTENQSISNNRNGGWGNNRRNSRGRGRGRGQNQRNQQLENHNHGRGRGQGGNNSKSADKFKVECYRCHKFGHYKSECRTDLSKVHGEGSHFI